MGGRKPYELVGQRYGRLTVIEQAGKKNGFTNWLCECDCGNMIVVQGTRLVHGQTKSCGCLSRDIVVARNKSMASGLFRDERIYRIYWGIVTRCYNTKDVSYKRYGARGIKMCDEWKNSFYAFQEWALSNGYQCDLSIDRIDNDGDYAPNNCRWADAKTQANNRSSTKRITIDGVTHSVSEWAAISGIDRNTIYRRLSSGWDTLTAIYAKAVNTYA